jgi:hypothetical protein
MSGVTLDLGLLALGLGAGLRTLEVFFTIFFVFFTVAS